MTKQNSQGIAFAGGKIVLLTQLNKGNIMKTVIFVSRNDSMAKLGFWFCRKKDPDFLFIQHAFPNEK